MRARSVATGGLLCFFLKIEMRTFHFANLISKIAFFSSNEKSTQKNDVSKTQKIRSFRSLKLKVLRGQKLENWELEKINERIVFLKSEVEHLKSKLTLAKQDLEELEIISKTYKK